ncbi:hypothetical protein AcdelDRAFT_1168 [Acidovorax delafieldii 2AN]|uniref:Uncharacterized protein n=1 Tax=Acidovorax delafieldii 2AN TaxID=573060 RepID=C5T2N8_ACIDE|nr:hypothetical protein AcdelDRAFT_1168 [Acidovorax delafieldii 2AN]
MKHPLSRFASSPSRGTPPLARQSRFHGGLRVACSAAFSATGQPVALRNPKISMELA